MLRRPCAHALWILPWLFAVQPARAADRTCPIPTCDPKLIGYRALQAADAVEAPLIDGRLDDRAWTAAAEASGFIQGRPVPGAASTLRTTARVLVDATTVYVAVQLDDPNPAGIRAPFLRRDNEGLSDWVFVEFDSRRDRRSAFSFGLNPRGVQVDGVFTDDVNYDVEWNAVWRAEARIGPRGWTAEFAIPLTQLAFSGDASGDQVWGFNVYRYSPQHGESSNWSPRFAGLPGCVSQFNDLHVTLRGAPRRLEITPFVAPRVESGAAGRDGTLLAGADVSAGLGSSFVLTATALPDFGQVEADPAQINLTTFELFQTERRPFFVENAGAFAFDAGLDFATRGTSFQQDTPFYSRRIGRPPAGRVPDDAAPEARPDATTILGAAKLTGRTRRGWTIGMFTAATAREDIVVASAAPSHEVPLEPAALTTVVRASRAFRNGESSLGGIVAGVDRLRVDGGLEEQFGTGAWVLGLDGRHRFAGRGYELRGWMLGSRVEGSRAAIAAVAADPRHGFTRPDARQAWTPSTSMTGAAGQVRFARVAGSWQWSLAGERISPGFEVNDLGFQRNADWTLVKADWHHETTTTDGWVRRWTFGSKNLGVGWSTSGEPRAKTVDAFVRADFRSYWDATLEWTRDLPALSMEWLRGGPALRLPTRDTFHAVVDTDTRNAAWSAILDASASREPDSGSWSVSLAPQLSARASERIEWSLAPALTDETVGWQYVAQPDGRFVVARLRQRTVSLTARTDVIFTVHALLQLYVQPFVSTGAYDRYQVVAAPRAARPSDRVAAITTRLLSDDRIAARLPDGSAVSFDRPDEVLESMNATAVFRWEYRPGSFVTAVWNHRLDAGTA
ncbi:MAG TPA: DUF5916 domain-containing protein, partial [Vicinamibacterales bacterium]|nr:DUF5916 domain-containing protein [Vicinamibacterales bacterium]